MGLSSSNVGHLKFYVVSDDVTSEDSLIDSYVSVSLLFCCFLVINRRLTKQLIMIY